jgi:hypothetical protein
MGISKINLWGFDQYEEEFLRDTARTEEAGKRYYISLFLNYEW